MFTAHTNEPACVRQVSGGPSLAIATGVRILLATACVVGCSFEHGVLEEQPGGGVDPTVDSGTSTARTCKYPDPELRLCIEFDDNVFSPLAHDASPYGLDAITLNVGEYLRDNTPAAVTAWDSKLSVGEHAMLDINPAITIEAWMAVLVYHSASLVSNDGQYALRLDPEGRISCRIGDRSARSTQSIGTGAWRHVACVYDGDVLSVFVDGSPQDCEYESTPIPTAGTLGTRLAAGYVGAIDDIRIYARALTAADVCTHADRTDCSTRCDLGSGGPGPGGGWGGGD